MDLSQPAFDVLNWNKHAQIIPCQLNPSPLNLAAENFADILKSYAVQQSQQQQQIQLKNSQLQQIISLTGFQNATSDQLAFQLYPPEPRIIQSCDELPYPPEIIDDLLESYFKNSFWPLNFLHGPSFIANRYKIPRALLCVLCARGYKYSKFKPYLSLQGDVEEELLQYAKKSFDYEDISFNSLVTNMQFFFLYKDLKKQQAWLYISTFLSLVNEDPDVIERKSGIVFSLIEKEMRRRIWWLLRIMNVSRNTIVSDFPTHNVRTPLSLETFESISENQSVLMSIPTIPGTPRFSVEPIAFEMMLWKDRLTHFHTKICDQLVEKDNTFDLLETLIQATNIQSEFQLWFNSHPDWFRNVLENDNIYVNRLPPKDPDQIPWLAPNLHLLYHALSAYPYRFLLVVISGSKYLDPLQKEISKEFISVSIEFCLKHQRSLFSVLKNYIIPLDPEFNQLYHVSLYTLGHFSIFSSVMSDIGETEEIRMISGLNFKFAIELFKKISLIDEYKIADSI
ncbi:hypothetical protein HK096_002469, partial [Nowakowskiella sp. JEL0078]